MRTMYPGSKFGQSAIAFLLVLMLISSAALAEAMLFRGQFVYVVPEDMGAKMTELASKNSWKHFPHLTRLIDNDGDDRPDYVAIALGAAGGYGAQVRYRLSDQGNGSEPRLGLWYWGVITDETGAKIFEEFNP